VGFLVILGRLLDLQVIRGAYYTSLAEENRVRRIPILAPRGSILDRNGEVISFSEKRETNDDDIKTKKDILIRWDRRYQGAAFGHITEYLGYTKEDEVGKVRGDCAEKGTRKPSSFVGRTGLEEMYDCTLSGIDGEELIEVDAMGEFIRSLGRKEPIKGEDLKTTIDFGLQQKIHTEMNGVKGAVVALGPNGEVLALYSSPSFDPAIFVTKERAREVKEVLTNTNLPLFNRAIGGLYHPGSIYKPLVALAALTEGVISSDYTYEDTGNIAINTNYGDYLYNNWYFTQYGGKEGAIDVRRALARSTDTFFYEIGDLLGVENIVRWSETFGLDTKTGIDLPGEVSGLVPSPEWKLKTKGERWFLGNTYHLAIGQGDLAVTPLSISTAIAAIASDGKLCKPHIVGETSECKPIDVSQKNINIIKEGMEKACETGGTAYPFFDFEPKVACKTGTAETEGGKDGDTHAWFTVFAPLDTAPDIILTVLVERGGEGSKVASPIAKKILEYWYYEKNGLAVPTKSVPSITENLTPTPLPGTAE
jgi:penicillin-binding protein 2